MLMDTHANRLVFAANSDSRAKHLLLNLTTATWAVNRSKQVFLLFKLEIKWFESDWLINQSNLSSMIWHVNLKTKQI